MLALKVTLCEVGVMAAVLSPVFIMAWLDRRHLASRVSRE
jgi:hypothetical protein